MAKSKLFQLDGLIALSFFLINLGRVEWIEGPARAVLITLVLISIGFVVTLFFTQHGFSTLSPLGLGAVLVGFLPSVFWYLVRLASRLEFPELAHRLEGVYEVANYASIGILVLILPYLFLRKQR